MRKILYLVFLLCLGLLTACEQADMTTLFNPDDVTFYATNGDLAATKTILQADGTIQWLPKEEINLFYGNTGSAKFISDNTEQAGTVTFKGALTDFSYREGVAFWAVYPYREAHVYTGDAVTVSLPSQQTAIAGSFADDLFVSIARTTDFTLYFYNVCGGIKFCVTETGVKTVTFQGNGNEPVAGSAKVGFNSEGKPEIIEVTEPVTTITLTPPDGSLFEKGAWYYIAVWPTALESGYKIVLTKEDGTSTVKRNGSPVTVKRAIWGVLENLDTGLVYKQRIPDNEIWYTTTDGQIIESAYLSDMISNVYENGKGRMIFRDPLTTIPSYGFDHQERLKTMSLPESVTEIGVAAFALCNNLSSIDMPGVVRINCSAFDQSGLSGELTLPDSLEEIDSQAFFNCQQLESVVIPIHVKRIGDGAFMMGSYTQLVLKPTTPPALHDIFSIDFKEALFDRECLIIVPEESLASYQTADYWKSFYGYITVEGKMPPDCWYASTDYSKDGEVVVLKEATVGKGIDLIFLSDGFLDRDLEPGGIFEQQVRVEVADFFSLEPYRSLQDRFRIALVNCVSKYDVYYSPFGDDRTFTCNWKNNSYYFRDWEELAPIDEHRKKCLDYAKKALSREDGPIYAIVLLKTKETNTRAFCEFEGIPPQPWAIACSNDRRPDDPYCIVHEMGGHGIALLGDEYGGVGSFPEDMREGYDIDYANYGSMANLDWRSNPEEVRWSRFLKDARYAEEGLGVYEGGSLYQKGIFHPSEQSVMNGVGPGDSGPSGYDGWFNAPCREQIYKQVMKFSEGPDWKYDFETFVEFDAAGREQAKTKYKEWQDAYAAWLLQNGQN